MEKTKKFTEKEISEMIKKAEETVQKEQKEAEEEAKTVYNVDFICKHGNFGALMKIENDADVDSYTEKLSGAIKELCTKGELESFVFVYRNHKMNDRLTTLAITECVAIATNIPIEL